MPVVIRVRHNLAELAKGLDDLTKRQLPFAIALALTRTAQDVRDRLQGGIPRYFTERSSWVRRSIQMDMADRKDPDPSAVVGSLYPPMALHAEGGPKTGSEGVAVPVWARPKETDRTRPAKFPGRLAKKPDFFIAPFQRAPFRVGRGAVEEGVGLFQRVGKRGDKRHLKLWWTLRDSVQIKQDWPFEGDAVAVVEAELIDNFWAALEQARATAKPRA